MLYIIQAAVCNIRIALCKQPPFVLQIAHIYIHITIHIRILLKQPIQHSELVRNKCILSHIQQQFTIRIRIGAHECIDHARIGRIILFKIRNIQQPFIFTSQNLFNWIDFDLRNPGDFLFRFRQIPFYKWVYLIQQQLRCRTDFLCSPVPPADLIERGNLFRLEPVSYHLRRIPGNNRIRWYILCNHSPRCHNRSIANRDSPEHDHAISDPAVIHDNNLTFATDEMRTLICHTTYPPLANPLVIMV